MVNATFSSAGDMVITEEGAVREFNNGDVAWVMSATTLVMIMTPGTGLLYSGLLRRRSALAPLLLSLITIAIISMQWFLVGYSLTFSSDGGPFIGNLAHFGLMNVLAGPSPGSPRIPEIAYAFFQLMFATVTPMLLIGAVSERGRLGPAFLFIFIWATLVYDPVARWTWSPQGWGYRIGALDFAGGGPVHMSSGCAAYIYSWYLGKRDGWGTERLAFKPTQIAHVCLGTVFLWFGWIGFNAGSALSADLRALQAAFSTMIASSAGGLTWMLLDYRWEQRWSAVGFCSGVVSGLVCVTPASGYIGSPSALAFGILGATACNQATRIKYWMQVDDAVDVASLHFIGGLVGNLLTGIFADSRVATFDGSVIKGGWINRNWMQMVWQVVLSAATLGYVSIGTYVILVVLNRIPGCKLRMTAEEEAAGIDDTEIGEFAYDYAYFDREPDENRAANVPKRAAPAMPPSSNVQYHGGLNGALRSYVPQLRTSDYEKGYPHAVQVPTQMHELSVIPPLRSSTTPPSSVRRPSRPGTRE